MKALAESPDGTPKTSLDQREIRTLQLEASRLQLRIHDLSAAEHERYEEVMRALKENDAEDWGD